ncbi:MAG: hypothetical protein NZ927_05000 [Candidatus Calescibacterium sp.]|nr:hypothetical protein [Candidatus Calescibacterium sp.]MDW8087687.1 hypothetical protein [Candidatus Calescibacterium sp.]
MFLFILTTFLISIDFKSYESWNFTEIKNVKIYWEDEISSFAKVFVSLAKEQIESLEGIFGREIPHTNVVLFYEKDDTQIEFFFSPSRIFLVNLGGTRIEKTFYHIKKFEDIVESVLGCAFLMKLPDFIRVFPPDYLISPNYIQSFCEYITIKDDFFNFPFYGSKYSGTMKFIEIEYGRSKLFDLFLNGRIIYDKFSVYEDEFLRWRRSKFIYNENNSKVYSQVSKYIHGLNVFQGKILYFSDGYIKSIDNEKTIEVDFLDYDFGYLNGDGNRIIFDAKEDGFYKIYVVDGNEILKLELNGIRAWYPDVVSDTIVFVKKNINYDELCIISLKPKVQNFVADESLQEPECIFRAENYSEIFTPDFSPDGSKIVFSLRRSNGFFDIVLVDIQTREFLFLTQDSFADIFPKWSDSASIIFSSNRAGSFNLFQFNINTNRISRITEHNEGVFLGIRINDSVFGLSYNDFSVYVSESGFREYENLNLRRESIYTRVYENNFEAKKVGFEVDDVGILPPYIYTSLPGFFIGRVVFFLVDDLFRNNLYFGIDWRLPIYRWKLFSDLFPDVNIGGSSLGFFIRGLMRFSNPYIFFKLRYEPFNGIFVRSIEREHEFFPERAFSSSAILIHPLRKSWFFWGVDFSDYKLTTDFPSTSFWNMVKDQYRDFGQGSFVNPLVGFFLRTARKSFYLENGLDFLLSSSLITRRLGLALDTGLNLFSPSLSIFIFNLGLNGFFALNVPRRFQNIFGSKEIPSYLDPPYDLSPLRRFSPISFDFDQIGYEIGNIRGVRPRRSDLGGVLNFRTYINVFKGDFDFPADVEFVNVIPFVSVGGIRNLQNKFDFYSSYGIEADLETEIFFSLPLTLKFGFARGEISEFYFAVYITPGVFRN